MFDKLIESEPKGSDFEDRRRYFAVSSVVVGILFTAAVVVSIFAADYGLGTGNFELVEMIAPNDLTPVEPEPPEPQQPRSQSQAQTEVAKRQVNMARMEDTPPAVPTSISTTQNTEKERPKNGYFAIGKFDTDPIGGNTTGRTINSSAIDGPGLSTLAENTLPIEKETDPPPAIKKVAPPSKPVSRGVLNGEAKNLPKPIYSAAAKAVGAQGQVTVQVTIDENGRVVSANAVNGHVLLRSEAEKAARAARFSPTLLSDVPVKVTGVITYNFVR